MTRDAIDVASDPEHSIRTLKGEVRVASRIIDYLSSGLYATPGACLKELVNNSYDADARSVQLSVKPSALTVTLEDDGVGLTAEAFEKHFRKIADSRKRESSDVTDIYKRKKIGKIGIGFIAANELCDRMRIESTVTGSDELLDVTVDFEAMRNEPAERRAEDGSIHKGDYFGVVVHTDPERHFTRVTLIDLKPDAKDALIRSEPEEMQSSQRLASLYGLRPETVRDVLANLATWSDLDLYSQTMIQVALNTPVAYADHWLATNIADRDEAVEKVARKFSLRAKHLGFNIMYDGTDVRKPVVLKAQKGACMVREIRHRGSEMSYTGYLFASHGTIAPKELQGVLLRIREAAVGSYSQDLLGFPQSRSSLLQRWVSGEIYASDELEDAMNIDRSTLRETHPAYVEMRRIFHQQLAEFLSAVRRDLYQMPAAARRGAEADSASKRITERLRAPRPNRGSSTTSAPRPLINHEAAAKEIEKRSISDPAAFTRKLSAAELYEIVTAVADKVLPGEQAGLFLKALAEELFQRGRSRNAP